MVGKRSKKLITAQRHYHTCPKCGLMDLCRTDSIHRCKGCGNIWAGAIKQPLPKISVGRKGWPRDQPSPRPEELLRRVQGGLP